MKNIYIFALLLLMSSCSDMFDYSPYSADVSNGMQNTTRSNYELLQDLTERDTIVVALISDSHYHYGDLADVVNDINSDTSVSVVLFGGDMADKGLLKEFELFHDKMKKLNVPYFTVIGNHDYRSNGEDIYEDMFGTYNYSIEIGNNKVIFFDDIRWESSKEPDFEWLNKELDNTEDDYDNTIIVAHIPPYNDQFNEDTEEHYTALMRKHKVDLSIHGHDHDYTYGKPYKEGIDYLVIGSVDKRYYVKLYITKEGIEVVRLSF